MNPTEANRDTQKKIQTSTPGGKDNVKAKQVVSDTNQGNGDNQRYTRGQNQNKRGNNQ